MGFKTLACLATLALSASAAVIDPANLEKRASCPSYSTVYHQVITLILTNA